jgi:predicted ATPase/transcriptional regulator with XRE-family HTH domain
MSYYPQFAGRLNRELQRQDRSASWLAQRLDVSPSTVARWLNHGTRPGTPEIVVQIADVLGITSDREALLTSAGYGYVQSPIGELGDDRGDSIDRVSVQTSDEAISKVAMDTAHVQAARLPVPATPLVGRMVERDRLAAWLADPDTRLVTILGPGGMGKTRLALAVASDHAATGHFEHGVAFVDLAPLSEVDQIPAAIAHALGLSLELGSGPVRSPEQQVIDFLQSRRQLLVLDNAEHLLDGANLVADIMTAAPRIHILVTSRAPLRLVGEQLFPLRGLEYTMKAMLTEQAEASASTLFLQSANRVRPSYNADPTERRRIADICRLVEGMPLAIELAASWVTLMSAAEILAAIHESLHFLETDLRGVPERHRSMEAVFDATWQRLGEREQKIFAQLSVFRGGFTREAIVHVTGATLAQLRSLAAGSLIVYDHERNRYKVHELLRQYGALRLSDAPELAQAANQAHSDFYFALLRRRQDALKSRGLQTDLLILDIEADNLSRAWDWAAQEGRIEGIRETLDGLGLYLQWRGRSDEGTIAFRSAAAALQKAGEIRHLVRALAWQALFVRSLGQFDNAADLLDQCRHHLDAASLGDEGARNEDFRSEQAFMLLQIGAAESARDTDAAEQRFLQSLAIFEALGEDYFVAEVLLGLGHIHLIQGDFDTQRQYVERALDTYRTLGNVRGTAAALSMLADIDSYRGRLISGLELGFEALASFRSLGDTAGTATCLSRMGMTYMSLGDVTNARQVVTESLTLFTEIGSRRDEVICHAFLCAIELMAGEYLQARANAEHSVKIAEALDDEFVLGVAIGFLGWTQLYTGNLEGALSTLREAITITKRTGATMDSVRWYAQLGLAQWKNGQGKQARAHAHECLSLAAQVVDPWSLLTAISTTIAILADGEHPERAVELDSMLMQDPLCTNSRWYQDGIGPYVTAAIHHLPAEATEAAKIRGRSLEQSEQAALLIEETSALGWVS